MRQSPGAMKPHFSLCLLLACASLLLAQDQPKDPFVKDKKAVPPAVSGQDGAVPPGPGDPDAPPAPKNIQCLLEIFTLSQADYAALLDAPNGHDRLYAQLQVALKAGTARLDGCHLITNKLNTRCTIESTDELIYPTEWTVADRAGFQYPHAFEMRQMGDHFEFEPAKEEGSEALIMTQAFMRDFFLGYRMFKADTTLPGIPVMDVFARNSTTVCRMLPGLPTLIATMKGTLPGEITLGFATLQEITLHMPKARPTQKKGNLIITARAISLDRLKGRELLKKHGMDGGACMADLKPLLAAKEATLEHIATITTQSGVRALHESGRFYTYGTQFSPPSEGEPAQPSEDPKKPGTPSRPAGQAGTTSLENRGVGFRLEVEPTISSDSAFAEMTLASEYVSMTGNVKDKNWNEHYPEVPLFSVQKIITGYAQVIGTTTLLGTLNPPGDTGVNEHKDTGRMWLLFMDVNPE